MILGSQESGAGGLHLAFERGARDRADAVQVFTKSSRQWAARPLGAEEVRAFRKAHRAFARPKVPAAAHASYLINLAAASEPLYQRSVTALFDECQRAEALGLHHVIVHPGAAQGMGPAAGIRRVARALREICRALGRQVRVRLLLEITAGQGSCVGSSPEELAEILERAGETRLGVCLDTQHMWAAGLDWTTARGYQQTFQRVYQALGLRSIEAFHLNDSKKPLGSRVDRHAVIGDGLIGLAPFRRLLADPRFARVPGYLETPRLPSGEESFAHCLKRLRTLLPAA